jgi:hypothetical protein
MPKFYATRSIVSKSMAFGAIGGFVGGLVMSPFLIITAILTGVELDTMPIAMGLMFGPFTKANALTIGFGMHMLTSTLIGVIFGAVTSLVCKLVISTFRKGIIEGAITGIIAFVVISIPISMSLAPILMNMAAQMNPTMSPQQIMSRMQQDMPVVVVLSIIRDLVYGVTLGVVTTFLIVKAGIERGRQELTK